jgi:putative transposase
VGREFGVEPICRVLSEHGCQVAPGTYRAAAKRPPCARVVRDEELVVEIRRVHGENYGVYGLARCENNCTVMAPRSPGERWNV